MSISLDVCFSQKTSNIRKCVMCPAGEPEINKILVPKTDIVLIKRMREWTITGTLYGLSVLFFKNISKGYRSWDSKHLKIQLFLYS